MTLTPLGTKSIGECVPVAVAATAAAKVSLGLADIDLKAKAAALALLQARVTIQPPTLDAQVAASAQLQAALVGAMAVGAPLVPVDVSAIATAMAQLTADIGTLQTQLSIALEAQASLGGAAVHLLRYDGPAGQLAGGVPGVAPETEVHAVVVVATSPAAEAAIRGVFAV